ncbi:MAG: C4-dicarboxylate ABC transporter, partial [Rhodospirillales bacterium]|nr:C4-dicarboxylate ABC transporter [Rhodospirillales bacterium]
ALQLFAGLPFGPEPREFLAWFLHGGGQKAFEKLYQRRNIHALACGLTIPGGGWFKSQVSAPADFKGLNVAAAGLASKVLAKLGVEPALFAAGDIRQALKQGSVAGALVSLPSADLSLEIQREAKNYYFPGWQHQAGVLELLINLERWRALGREQQTRIRQVCVANLGASLAAGEAAQFGALKQLVLDGVEVRRWSPEMIKALGNAWSAVLADEIARDKDFKRIWKGLKEFRTDYAIWRELGYL